MLPAGAASKWQLGKGSTIELSVAALDEDVPLPGKKNIEKEKKKKEDKSRKKERESPDFTIELVTSDGAIVTTPLSRFISIPPPFKEMFTKLEVIESKAYEKDWEPVFQSVRIPLAEFQSAEGSKRFDPGKLSMVRLKFDRTAMSEICIGGVGFGKQ
jgi:hypothetical protein